MKSAKPNIDVGLFTNRRDEQIAFWRDVAGLSFDHTLKLGGGVLQHRFNVHGAVVKVNDARDPLPEKSTAGIQGLVIARAGLQTVLDLSDPDRNEVALVPPGYHGVTTIGVRVGAVDLAASERFYQEALGMDAIGLRTMRCGEALIFLQQEARQQIPELAAKGFRYLTLQVQNCDTAHAHALVHGAREARAPMTLGTTARVSFVLDPDGTWIELSERASLTGSSVER